MGPGKPGKSWNFILAFSRTGKCWEKTTGPESAGNLLNSLNARIVSFRIPIRWPIHIINLVDKTKLSCKKYEVYGGQ